MFDLFCKNVLSWNPKCVISESRSWDVFFDFLRFVSLSAPELSTLYVNFDPWFYRLLLLLLEQIEDAADEENTAAIAPLNRGLAADVEGLSRSIKLWNASQARPSDDDLPLLDCLGRIAAAVNAATPLASAVYLTALHGSLCPLVAS